MTDQRILLLEDEEAIAGLLELTLDAAGYGVDVACTLAAAHQRLDENAYSLVVADWRLPDGDGLTIADRAADLGAKTAVFTGYGLQLTPSKAARHEVWMKPMRLTDFVAAVQRRIGKASAKVS